MINHFVSIIHIDHFRQQFKRKTAHFREINESSQTFQYFQKCSFTYHFWSLSWRTSFLRKCQRCHSPTATLIERKFDEDIKIAIGKRNSKKETVFIGICGYSNTNSKCWAVAPSVRSIHRWISSDSVSNQVSPFVRLVCIFFLKFQSLFKTAKTFWLETHTQPNSRSGYCKDPQKFAKTMRKHYQFWTVLQLRKSGFRIS